MYTCVAMQEKFRRYLPRTVEPQIRLRDARGHAREASSLLLLVLALAITFQVAYQLLRTVIALPHPRTRTPRWSLGSFPARAPAPTASPVTSAPVVLTPTSESRGAFTALRHGRFILYLGGSLVGAAGTLGFVVTQTWVAFRLTDSPAGIAILLALTFAPAFVLAFPAGLLADRLDSRWIVVVARLLAAAGTVALAYAAAAGTLTIPVFAGASLAIGVLRAIERPAAQTLPNRLVDHRACVSAHAWQGFACAAASAGGAIVAGTVIYREGPGPALALVAGADLVFALSLLPVRMRRPLTPAAAPRVESGGPAVSRVPAFLLAAMVAVASGAAWGILPLLPFVARDTLGRDAITFGWLVAAIAAGSALGALVSVAGHRVPIRAWLVIGGAGAGGAGVLMLAYPQTVETALLNLFLAGGGVGAASMMHALLVQAPAVRQGRTAGTLGLGAALQVAAILAVGFLAQAYGAPLALWAAGVGGLGATGLGACSHLVARLLR